MLVPDLTGKAHEFTECLKADGVGSEASYLDPASCVEWTLADDSYHGTQMFALNCSLKCLAPEKACIATCDISYTGFFSTTTKAFSFYYHDP